MKEVILCIRKRLRHMEINTEDDLVAIFGGVSSLEQPGAEANPEPQEQRLVQERTEPEERPSQDPLTWGEMLSARDAMVGHMANILEAAQIQDGNRFLSFAQM